MLIALVASNIDPAGLNIKNQLLSLLPFTPSELFEHSITYQARIGKHEIRLYTLATELISRENIEEEIAADFFIFISRHMSKYPYKVLTAHPVGNWGAAEHGGKSGRLVSTSALMLKTIVQMLDKHKPAGYDVAQEATHHGPFMRKPALFVEIGSTSEEWDDGLAGSAAAKALAQAIALEPRVCRVAVGLGGLHNTPSFKRVILETDIAVSHTCAKYALKEITGEMLRQAVARTLEPVDFFLLDWKGMGEEKHRIVDLLTEHHLDFKKVHTI